MAIEFGQCPKTFRTQRGKEWHAQHIHADQPVRESNGQIKTDELSAIVENEIMAQISDLSSPLNVALDERIARILAQVEPNSLTPYLRDLKPAKVEDESDPLAPYLRDS